jgi:hypothetical protein
MTQAGDLEVLAVPDQFPDLPAVPASWPDWPAGDKGNPIQPGRARPGHARWPRWPTIGVATLVVLFILAVPVRTEVAKHEFRWLSGRIAQYHAIEDARPQAVQAVNDAAFPGDEDRVSDATYALSLEEAARLDQLDHSVAGAVLVDGKVAKLRRTFRQLLAARQLAPVDGFPLTPGVDESERRVDDLLAAEEHRFGTGSERPARPIRLHAADATIASLHHWLDQPTGLSLLALAPDGVFRLDVDASQAHRLSSSPVLDGALIPRLGYVALFGSGSIFVQPSDFHTAPRLIGLGDQAFAADRPDALWVITDKSIGEVDGAGRWLVPPVSYQGFVSSISVRSGVVIHEPDGLIVWDPASGRTVCSVATAGEPIAGSGDLLAWVETDGRLYLTDVSSCQTRPADQLDPATYLGFLGAAGAMSPDGRTLAAYVALQTGGLGDSFRLALVDVATGRVTVPDSPDRSATVEPIVWTADSTRVFFTISTSGGASLPAMYRLGQSGVTPMRYRATPGFSVLAVLPSGPPAG